jgi:hypothetical protein
MKCFHNIKSFLTHGYKERSTLIGIAVLFGWVYHKEINQLVINILTSPELVTKVIDGLVTLFAGLAIIYKQKK